MFLRALALIVLVPSLLLSYTVVRKDGRPFSGELVRQDDRFVVIRDNRGIEVKFRTDQLDPQRTADANKGGSAKPQTAPATRAAADWRDGSSQWTGELISVDFKDIDIKDFFRFIADLSGMNLILDPAVRGSLTIKLTDVPWDQALDLVCRTHGLGYEIDGNVVSVK